MNDYIKPGDPVIINNVDLTLDKELWFVQDTKLFPKILLMNEKYPPLIVSIGNVQKLGMAV